MADATDPDAVDSRSAARSPSGPTAVGAGSWLTASWRTLRTVTDSRLTDWAAALTYYGVLAIFPALLAVVAILGVIGRSATQPLQEDLTSVAPGAAKQIFVSAIENIQNSRGTAGVLLVLAVLGAIWSASGYVGAFMRAANAIYEIGEGRPAWKTIPTRLVTTVVLLLLLAVSAIAVVFTGGLASQLGKLLGVSATAVTVWDIAKWPVLVLIVSLMLSILYWTAPNVRHPRLRWLSPGSLFAVLLWLITSGAFAAYVANFGSYNKTYGALASVIVFLVWLWISNIAVLLGAKLNAELERERQVRIGAPPQRKPFAQPRDTRKLSERERRTAA